MNLKSRLLEMSGAALIAALLGCSMSLTLLDALSVSFSTWQVILTGALTSLVCAAFLLGRIPALISAVCLGGGLGLLLAKNVSIIGMLKETLIALLTALVGGEGSLNEHALTLMIVMTVALTLISFLLTRLTGQQQARASIRQRSFQPSKDRSREARRDAREKQSLAQSPDLG